MQKSGLWQWRVIYMEHEVTVLYSMGQEKVARLPFCTCICDILSRVSKYIA